MHKNETNIMNLGQGHVGKGPVPHFIPDFCSMDLFVPNIFFLDIPNDTCSEQTIHERLMKKKTWYTVSISVFHGMHGTRRVFSPSLSPCDPPRK